MANILSKIPRKWIIVAIVVVLAGILGYKYWKSTQFAVPEGIAWGNGRIEAKLVDASAKEPLRVKEILVDEGDLVKPGQVVVRLDTSTLDAELAKDRAGVAAAQEQLAEARAAIVKRKSEIKLAQIEVERSRKLLADNATSQREYDVRTMTAETTTAGLAQDEARLQTAQREVEVAQASVTKTQTRIDDATLTSPVLGRVLYRLTEPGEVLGAGGKALTIVNLEDVYMEIFVPSAEAAAIKSGADARITMDYAPGQAVAARVSFVSPEAQFTPKQVETKSEREKLMFRVKLQVPPELVTQYIEGIKTGVRGVGYVKVSNSAVWPEWLEKGLLRPTQSEGQQAGPAQPEPAAAPQ
jgi:HlyD family secretion protein